MPLTGKDVWEAIVKAGLLSGPYDPRTNRHCANADLLAGLLNEVLSKRQNWLPNLLETGSEFLELPAPEPGAHLRKPRLLLFLDVMGDVLDQHRGLGIKALFAARHPGKLQAEDISDVMFFVRLQHVVLEVWQ